MDYYKKYLEYNLKLEKNYVPIQPKKRIIHLVILYQNQIMNMIGFLTNYINGYVVT